MPKKSTPAKIIDPKSLEGRKFRFVVSSAEDAANIIRERLGENAQVLSVKQVNGKGLTKFLSSPQLEIIVTVPKSEPQTKTQTSPPAPAPVNRLNLIEDTPVHVPAEELSPPPKTLAEPSTTKPLSHILNRAGFDPNLIQGLKASPEWDSIQALPVSHGIAEITHSLKKQYHRLPQAPTTSLIAFFGTPGAGTTSALCKQLSSDVFINNKTPSVLKLESDTPNPDDALRVFCNVIGVPIFAENDPIPDTSDQSPLYVDVTGSSPQDYKHWTSLKQRLHKFKVDTRVLVINAAYDPDIIKSTLRLSDSLNATHLVFSHVDELPTTSKLWPFILLSGLPTLFLSSGQDVTSDMIHDVADHLLQKSFPSIVLN